MKKIAGAIGPDEEQLILHKNNFLLKIYQNDNISKENKESAG